MTNRVDIDGVLSKDMIIKYEVPQGSIIALVLFLLYVNDLQSSANMIILFGLLMQKSYISAQTISEVEQKNMLKC